MANADAVDRDRLLESVRTALQYLTGLGLLLLFGNGLVIAFTDGGVNAPDAVWKSGLIISAVGCAALAVVIARWFTSWESLWWDATLGVLSCLAALLALAASTLVHGVVGHRVFFAVVLTLLFGASVTLLLVCWRTVRRKERAAAEAVDADRPIEGEPARVRQSGARDEGKRSWR